MLIKIIERVLDEYQNLVDSTEHFVPFIRIQPIHNTISNINGLETIAKYRLFFPPGVNIKNNMLIEYENNQYEIISVYKARDKHGNIHHIEVTV